MNPSFEIRWLVDRMHAGTPYEVVAGDIADRARDFPPRVRSELITAAVIQHRRNRRLMEMFRL